MKVPQVILVEGKTDVEKIRQAYPNDEMDFIISNGLGFDDKFLFLCRKINETRGLIVFTDPDGPGNIIRDRVNSYLDYKCKNAFIDKNKIINRKKIGVAEAELADIVAAIDSAIEFKGNGQNSITWDDYLQNEFNLKPNRRLIANYFSWSSEINAKTLFKWLNYTQLIVDDIKVILKQG